MGLPDVATKRARPHDLGELPLLADDRSQRRLASHSLNLSGLLTQLRKPGSTTASAVLLAFDFPVMLGKPNFATRAGIQSVGQAVMSTWRSLRQGN